LKENGADLAPFHAYDAKIPAETKRKIAEAKQAILDGKIKVPFDQSAPN
jgi:hypothetical protein